MAAYQNLLSDALQLEMRVNCGACLSVVVSLIFEGYFFFKFLFYIALEKNSIGEEGRVSRDKNSSNSEPR